MSTCRKVGPSLEVPVLPSLASPQKQWDLGKIWARLLGKEATDLLSSGAEPPMDIAFASSLTIFVILVCLAMIFYIWHYFNNKNKKEEKISW